MRRRTFEQVALRNDARRCVRDLRALGVESIRLSDVLSFWRGIGYSYRMDYYRWLDRCRMARERSLWRQEG